MLLIIDLTLSHIGLCFNNILANVTDSLLTPSHSLDFHLLPRTLNLLVFQLRFLFFLAPRDILCAFLLDLLLFALVCTCQVQVGSLNNYRIFIRSNSLYIALLVNKLPLFGQSTSLSGNSIVFLFFPHISFLAMV